MIVEICSYLNLLDKYNFLIALKYYDMIKQHIINEINHRLMNIFGNQLSDFKQCMKNTGSIISGSFILQCILKEDWNSDIDIYVPMIGNTIYPPSGNKDETNFIKSDVDNFMYYQMNFKGRHDIYADLNSVIKYVRNYYKQNQIIQIIGIDIARHDVSTFINDTFDFSICKNAYYFDGKDNLVLSNLNNIYHKMLNFESKNAVQSSISRYYKYQKRGFVFKNKNSLTYDDLKPKNTYIYRSPPNAIKDTSRLETLMKQLFGSNIIDYHCTRAINERWYTKTCSDSCVIHFLDEGINHTHINKPLKYGNKEDDHLFIHI